MSFFEQALNSTSERSLKFSSTIRAAIGHA